MLVKIFRNKITDAKGIYQGVQVPTYDYIESLIKRYVSLLAIKQKKLVDTATDAMNMQADITTYDTDDGTYMMHTYIFHLLDTEDDLTDDEFLNGISVDPDDPDDPTPPDPPAPEGHYVPEYDYSTLHDIQDATISPSHDLEILQMTIEEPYRLNCEGYSNNAADPFSIYIRIHGFVYVAPEQFKFGANDTYHRASHRLGFLANLSKHAHNKREGTGCHAYHSGHVVHNKVLTTNKFAGDAYADTAGVLSLSVLGPGTIPFDLTLKVHKNYKGAHQWRVNRGRDAYPFPFITVKPMLVIAYTDHSGYVKRTHYAKSFYINENVDIEYPVGSSSFKIDISCHRTLKDGIFVYDEGYSPETPTDPTPTIQKLTGYIKNINGDPIIATIKENGTTNTTHSGSNGRFVIFLRSMSSTISISAPGYYSKSYIATSMPANIILLPEEQTPIIDDPDPSITDPSTGGGTREPAVPEINPVGDDEDPTHPREDAYETER